MMNGGHRGRTDGTSSRPTSGSPSLRRARIEGIGPTLEPTVPMREPRILLVDPHFRAREGRSHPSTDQTVVLGSRLTQGALVAIGSGLCRGDFLPGDIPP